MPHLKKVYFLADKSDCWHTLHGTQELQALSLHNLKSGTHYLDSTGFSRTFPVLKYLYVKILGVDSLPEISDLPELRAICIQPRNENAIRNVFDFSSFESAPTLEIFDGHSAVDRHRVPAEWFIPVLKNPTLRSFSFSQMYATENKKLQKLIAQYHPSLPQTTLSYDAFMSLLRQKFAE